jgi:hypothetical protein
MSSPCALSLRCCRPLSDGHTGPSASQKSAEVLLSPPERPAAGAASNPRDGGSERKKYEPDRSSSIADDASDAKPDGARQILARGEAFPDPGASNRRRGDENGDPGPDAVQPVCGKRSADVREAERGLSPWPLRRTQRACPVGGPGSPRRLGSVLISARLRRAVFAAA